MLYITLLGSILQISADIKSFFIVVKHQISPTECNVTLFFPGLDIQKI
jgi:hypothetical protein